MLVRRLLLAAAPAFLGALVFAGSAEACSCAPIAPREALERADAAIVGRLVAIVPRGDLRADYRYKVQRVYRGGGRIKRGRVIAVRSASRPSACALPRRIGRSYGLFLVWGEGRWTGGVCGVVEPRRLRAAAGRSTAARPRSSGSPGGCGG
jgi:hypothetical protein